MGKAKWLFGDGVKGQIGNNLYYLRKGMQVIRKCSSNYSGSESEKVLLQQLIFLTLSNLAVALYAALQRGVTRLRGWSTPRTWFMSRNADVVTATSLENGAEVDFPSLVCAEGRLVPPEAEVVHDEEARTLSFTLSAQEVEVDCNEDDVMYAAILSAGARYRCLLRRLGARSEGGMVSVSVPKYLDGDLHVYVFATTADGKTASDSIYLPLA